MIVAVAVFEIHIPHSRSLKEKRAVVRSLRDRLRSRWEVSAAEVGLQELHQRARLAVAMVASDGANVEPLFEEMAAIVEQQGDASLVGWNLDLQSFEEDLPLDASKYE